MTRPFPCCCSEVYPCESDCDSGVPDTVSFSVNGAANDSCTDWPDLDGTYTLDYQSCTTWSANFSTPVLKLNHYQSGCPSEPWLGYWNYILNITVQFSGNYVVGSINVWATVNFGGVITTAQEDHVFNSIVSRPDDCCAWSGFSLNYDSRSRNAFTSDYGGDLSTATVDITASASGC